MTKASKELVMRRVTSTEFGDPVDAAVSTKAMDARPNLRPLWLHVSRMYASVAPHVDHCAARRDEVSDLIQVVIRHDMDAGPEPLWRVMRTRAVVSSPEYGPGPIRPSVTEAALRLGISERAVRKRIQSGTMSAEPNGRARGAHLPPASEAGSEAGLAPHDRRGSEPGSECRLGQARESIMVGLLHSMLTPLIVETGGTTEQLDRVAAERDELRWRAERAGAAEHVLTRRATMQQCHADAVIRHEHAAASYHSTTQTVGQREASEQRHIDRRIQLAMDQNEIAHMTVERDSLRDRLSAVEARQTEEIPVQASTAPQAATGAATAVPWWQLWKRR